MDQHQHTVMELRIKKTMKNLEQNNMKPFYAKDKAEAVQIVESLLNEGDTVTAGGTMTMYESGVAALLESGKYNFLDRNRPGITQEEIDDIYRKAFSADAYICSSNAVTENGELFNVDGNSNRVAAIVFGPKQVIMIVGYNKIVANLDEAILRVKKVAAPENAVRLNCDTYCRYNGECVSCAEGKDFDLAAGCRSDKRICCSYVVSSMQRKKNRIKVILVGEELGY